MKMNWNNFIDDKEKITDLLYLSKNDFLKSYSYISEEEYENTINKIFELIGARMKTNEKQKKKRNENLEEFRKKQMEYYYANRDKINAKRNARLKAQRKAAKLKKQEEQKNVNNIS